jgi:L,D-transpeptidase YcbB
LKTYASRRDVFCAVGLALAVLASNMTASPACAAQGTTASAAVPDQALEDIVASGKLADLRWPDFSDYRADVKRFYEAAGYRPVWSRNNQPTPQAQAIIAAFRQSGGAGLGPDDYDAPRWDQRIQQLGQPGAAARFDAALTVCVMRYISDLRIGKVNPKHLHAGLDEPTLRLDLPQFLETRLVSGQDVEAQLAAVEPKYRGYERTKAALQSYLKLAQQDDGQQLPAAAKPVDPGSSYAGTARLTRLLRLVGDLKPDTVVADGDLYQSPLVDAVKHFQSRHGIAPDGRLGPQTLRQLNIPLGARAEQLRLTLERWRWLPQGFPQPPVVVNIPEFRLRAFNSAGQVTLSTNVIVGKAYRHQTPVFDDEMRYVVFRPYWNVPPSIQRSEIVPSIRRDRDYIAKKNYEVTSHSGDVVTSGTISDEVLEQLRAGKLAVRQKPGPTNALGLVKLIFPNEYNVYLHSTPSQRLFGQERRDFSHGCIRVEKADELAAWALKGDPKWTLESVREAMRGGTDNLQVNLATPIPVLILYATAVADEDGSVLFFDDLYKHDAELKAILAKGYPYH